MYTYMWQSRVEIEGYSVAYFDHIAVFEAMYRWTPVKGGAHTCFVDAWISNESMKHTSPALNRSSVIWRFEGSDAIKICDGITFDFYTGLPHMYIICRSFHNHQGVQFKTAIYVFSLHSNTMNSYICQSMVSWQEETNTTQSGTYLHRYLAQTAASHLNIPLKKSSTGWTWQEWRVLPASFSTFSISLYTNCNI